MGLSYNDRNVIADEATERRDGGLSSFGLKVIERMNRLVVLIDFSHSSDLSIKEVVEASEAPCCCTHTLAKADLLLIDDWGLKKFAKKQSHYFLEILEDRHSLKSTLITSQLPIDHWHEIIADPTLADAILDRLVHNAYRINLKGESMRKKKSHLT